MKSLLMVASAALALASPAASQEVIQQPHAFGDWITACDWTRKCAAFSLPPEAGSDLPAELFVSITRTNGPGEIPQLKIEISDDFGPASFSAGMRLLIDGDDTGVPVREGHDLALDDQEAGSLIIQMHQGRSLSIMDQEGPVASLSLAGLGDALSAMDVKQGRDGTTEALILQGHARNEGSDPASAPPPIQVSYSEHLEPARAPTFEVLTRLKDLIDCPQPTFGRLDAATSLVLLTSECGGYGRSSVLALIDQDGAVRPAAFETVRLESGPMTVQPEPGGEAILTDASWDQIAQTLTVQRKDRAFGDCGELSQYAWDIVEKRFRLLSYASMPVCRGVRRFITTYQAERVAIPAGRIAQGVDCDPENTGLDWGLCNIPELRAMSLDIDAAQEALASRMDPASGQALTADWVLMLQSLHSEVGSKWYDVVKPDVVAALLYRQDFLKRISPRAVFDGEWENFESRIEISRDGGLTLLDVGSPSCEIRVILDREVTITRHADSLSLALNRESFEKSYPSLGGCFAGQSGPSVIDGVYFPVASSER